MLKGDLSLFSLAEIFQSLAINSHSGTLKIVSADQEDKFVCFQRGEITFFWDDAPSKRVSLVGEILVRQGVITREQLGEALLEQQNTKAMLGEILARKNLVTAANLKEALSTRTLEGLYDLFLLKEGTFEFYMNEVPEDLKDEIQRRVPISLNVNSVNMEGLRQIDEWGLISQKIRTFDEIFLRVDIPEDNPHDLVSILLDQVNGVRPVREFFKTFPGSRFYCCKLLLELLEKGYVRLLTGEECAERATENMAAGQFAQAANLLQFAAQHNPNRAATYEQLGDALSGNYQQAAAREAYLKALRLYHQQGDFQRVASLGESLSPKVQIEDEDLEKVFNAFMQLQNFKKAAETANTLVSSLQKKGDYTKAAIILEPIAVLNSDNLTLKIQMAGLFEKAGNIELATNQLEAVASTLQKRKKLRELIKVLRLLWGMNPNRDDLKARLAAAQSLQDSFARRRKFGLTIAGVASIVLLVCGLIPMLYELKARENFNHAERIEQISMLSMDFRRAKEAYLEIIKNYGFSTRAAEAEESLERITAVEREMLHKMENESQTRQKEQDEKRSTMKEELVTQLRRAQIAENAGDLKSAHAIYNRAVAEYADFPAAKNIQFPLRITTEPSGATVTADGASLGKTPLIHRYKPGAKVSLSVARASCEGLAQEVELKEQWEIHYVLKRKPIGVFSRAPAIHQPMHFAEGRMIFPSRDGNLYALDPLRNQVFWQRVVGRFGDRVSNITISGSEIYLGTVTGELTAMNTASGKPRWIARLDGSILGAPAVSEDRQWVAAGTSEGSVFLVENAGGTVVASFATENEIIAGPLLRGDILLAASTDNSLYGFSLSERTVRFQIDLDGDIVLDPILDRDAVVVATADGTIHRLEGDPLKVKWSRPLERTVTTPPGASPFGIHVGDSSGRVVTLDRATGELAWELQIGTDPTVGMAIDDKKLYAVLGSGKLVVLDLEKRKVTWDYKSSMYVEAPPLVGGGNLFLGGASGRIESLEVVP